jgi:disulfide bond formation protein DsbB
MSTSTGTLFLALLAVAAQVTVLAVAVVAITSRPTLSRLRAAVGVQPLQLAAVVALVSTVGSLWLSEGAGFLPCRLCWYQRIAMYPLAVVLGIAALRRDVAIRLYAIPLAAIGAAISIWHVLIERFPSLESSTSCEVANPCSVIWVERFGYLTIPTMALSGFALLVVLLLLADKESHA